MGLVLTLVKQRGGGLARNRHGVAQAFAGLMKQRLDLRQRSGGQREQIGKQRALGKGLSIMRHCSASFRIRGLVRDNPFAYAAQQ